MIPYYKPLIVSNHHTRWTDSHEKLGIQDLSNTDDTKTCRSQAPGAIPKVDSLQGAQAVNVPNTHQHDY